MEEGLVAEPSFPLDATLQSQSFQPICLLLADCANETTPNKDDKGSAGDDAANLFVPVKKRR